MLTPVLHGTDLFHPHEDPDDHWDLCCVFALAGRGLFDLRGILIDHPPNPAYGSPAVLAVAQMSYISGVSAPVSVGSATPADATQTSPEETEAEAGRIDWILKVLEESPEPVVVNIVGSCRDIAKAGKKNPDLFREKCRRIYLNAGMGTNDPELKKQMEYNVALEPKAYQAIFDLPCPIYWMPCFESLKANEKPRTMEYGTYYKFMQSDILEQVSPQVRQFFLYMLEKSGDPRWISYLNRPVDENLLRHFGALYRNMWCTAGFFHAAGFGVRSDGSLASLAENPGDLVSEFIPVAVGCDGEGRTSWKHDSSSTQRYLFRVRDIESYPQAMTIAMRELLKTL